MSFTGAPPGAPATGGPAAKGDTLSSTANVDDFHQVGSAVVGSAVVGDEGGHRTGGGVEAPLQFGRMALNKRRR